MPLVIVESPTKSRTLQGFLGPKYRVLSSYGHIRDLPEDEFGIDVENDFQPKYIIPAKAKKTIQLLTDAVKKTDVAILATDEDREGEAIAWHLTQALGLGKFQASNPKSQTNTKYKIQDTKPYERIVFHEITKTAIEEALKNPRDINIDLVDSQQARRILDRIVGYKLSPFLWKKVARGLSAGRVQSVAVRLVTDREKEIENFTPQEYWQIVASLRKSEACLPVGMAPNPKSETEFEAFLIKRENKTLDKLEIKDKNGVDEILKDLEGAEYKVEDVQKKEVKRNPLPPFTTSTLQQEAWQRFRFSAKLTMHVAQRLYETGKITYHRTDSLNLSNVALLSAEKFITENYGQNYWAGYSRKYKTKSKGAQEAHEAIRPAYPDRTPDKLKLEEKSAKLYDLIWRRFIACQMAQSRFDSTSVEIEAQHSKYIFRATGQVLKFDGFLRVYPIRFMENELPALDINEMLKLLKLTPSRHSTQPPPRFNEASLIKTLEENGIGRPSTYASILSTIQERNYIEKDEEKRFRPTEIGIAVNDLLVKHFPEVVDIQFTAKMERDLDDISDKKREWVPVIKEFYGPFEKNLEEKYKEVKKEKIAVQTTDKTCPKCSSPLLIRLGRFGKFYACSAFPKCNYTESLGTKSAPIGMTCPKCGTGEVVVKKTRRGKIFYGCSSYPQCDFATWQNPKNEIE